MPGVDRLFVWLNPGQEAFARAIAARLNATITAAGSPDRGKTAIVAAELGAAPADDIRTALISADCNAAILLAPSDFGSHPEGADVRALLQARSRGVRVTCMEASPTSAIDLLSCGWDRIEEPLEPDDLLVPVGLAWKLPLELLEVMRDFGPARAIQLSTAGPAVRGTLISRLIFSIGLLSSFITDVESVDASFVDAVGNPSIHLLPQDRLTELHGTLNCLVRFSGNRSATVLVSDQQSASFLEMRIISNKGVLDIVRGELSSRCTWIHTDGTREEIKIAECAGPLETDLIAAALESTLETEISIETALTFAQTALLSARTGEAESTSTIARILESARG